MEAHFPSESTLPLSGEINANKGSGEDWRSEKNDKKRAGKMQNKQRHGFKKRKKKREKNGGCVWGG